MYREHHGRGKIALPCGGIYEGNFSNGVREGTGVCRYASGDIYEGNWKNDKKEGRGVATYAVDGNVPDALLAYCAYSWNAKDKIDGIFKERKRHGACTYTFFNGEMFRCTFVEGRCAKFDQR